MDGWRCVADTNLQGTFTFMRNKNNARMILNKWTATEGTNWVQFGQVAYASTIAPKMPVSGIMNDMVIFKVLEDGTIYRKSIDGSTHTDLRHYFQLDWTIDD